jgi:hypothetical protein
VRRTSYNSQCAKPGNRFCRKDGRNRPEQKSAKPATDVKADTTRTDLGI